MTHIFYSIFFDDLNELFELGILMVSFTDRLNVNIQIFIKNKGIPFSFIILYDV